MLRLAPPETAPVSKKPWSEVTVCEMASWKLQVTVCPIPTRTFAGAKAMFATVTVVPAACSCAWTGTTATQGSTRAARDASSDLMPGRTSRRTAGFTQDSDGAQHLG